MITLNDIKIAQNRLNGIIVRTPLLQYPNSPADGQLFFKPENLQAVGAFKLRGAYNKIASCIYYIIILLFL